MAYRRLLNDDWEKGNQKEILIVSKTSYVTITVVFFLKNGVSCNHY